MVRQKLLCLSVCPVGAEEAPQHAGAPCRDQWNAGGHRDLQKRDLQILSAWRHHSPTGPQLCSHQPPSHLFSILFLFFQVEMTNSFQRTLVERTTYLCLLHSWPEPVQEMQVIYQRLLTGTEHGLPAQLRGSSLFLFTLLFHSSLLLFILFFSFSPFYECLQILLQGFQPRCCKITDSCDT